VQKNGQQDIIVIPYPGIDTLHEVGDMSFFLFCRDKKTVHLKVHQTTTVQEKHNTAQTQRNRETAKSLAGQCISS
jgi:hypothetical protein